MDERPRRRFAADHAWLIAGGSIVLAVTWLAATSGEISGAEESTFRFFNDWPDWLELPMWPVMQVGALAIVPLTAAVLWFFKQRRTAVGVLAAGVGAWLLAKVVKEFVGRGRPQDYLDGINLRPAWSGLGYVSGHAALAFAVVTLVVLVVPRRWAIVVWSLAVATAVLRIYTAAHLPLDVIGGAGLGLAVGGVARYFVAHPRSA